MTSAGAGNDSQNKSANAFKTISEVARVLDVPQHVLRFWETKFTQIKPMKRAGGRRYYRPEDVDLLSAIRQLLHAEGYTIRGVQKMMREKGVKSILSASQNPSEQNAPSAPSDPGAVVAKSSVTISASLKMSDTQKAELSAIRDDLLAIRSGLVGGSN